LRGQGGDHEIKPADAQRRQAEEDADDGGGNAGERNGDPERQAEVDLCERDLTAQVLGIEMVRYKLIAFALGSFYAGVAGGLLAYFNQFVNPEQFGLLLSVFFLSAVIVGGMGSTLGAVLGAAFMTVIPEVLREGALLGGGAIGVDMGTILTPLRETVFGLLMVTFLILEPRGLARLWTRASKVSRNA
jgi:branched-chain amino acid transport system permease protein